MARQTLQNRPFSAGLNTELNALEDNINYTKDELNVVINHDGSRSRRRGMDYENLYKLSNNPVINYSDDLAFSSTEWTDIGQGVNNPYIVIQVGGELLFYKNVGVPFSQAQSDYTLNLKNYAIEPNSDEYSKIPVSFTVAYGSLFIASKAIKPIVVKSLEETTVENPLPDNVGPSCTISCAIKYDHWGVRGGGWIIPGNIRWDDSDENTYPFASDMGYVQGGSCMVYIDGTEVLKVLSFDEYINYSTTVHRWGGKNNHEGPSMFYSGIIAERFNALPSEVRKGIVAEPKLWDEDWDGTDFSQPSPRTLVLAWREDKDYLKNKTESDHITFKAPDESGSALNGVEIELVFRYITRFKKSDEKRNKFNEVHYTGILSGGRSYEKEEGLTLKIRDFKGTEDFTAVTDTPAKISYSKLYNLLNQGWTTKLLIDFYNAEVGGYKCFPSANLAQQYLKDTDTSKFKPEALLDTTFGNTKAPNGHYIVDYFNQKRVEASGVVKAMEVLTKSLGEEIIDTAYSGGAIEQIPDILPRARTVTAVAAYAGHIFYLAGDVLLYSQVVTEDLQGAFKCYQDADPTSEEISDLVGTDGGYMHLPEIGEGQTMFVQGAYLVVVGDKGVVAIGGTANNIFLATAYSAFSLQPLTTTNPQSLVTTEYGTFYWGETGIVHCTTTETGGLSLSNISKDTIQSFYDKIPTESRRLCKGCYNANRHEIWWCYPIESKRLDGALVLNLATGSYTKHLFTSSQEDREGTGFVVPMIVCPIRVRQAFKSVKNYSTYTKDKVDIMAKDFTEVGGQLEIQPGTDLLIEETSNDTLYLLNTYSTVESSYVYVYLNDTLYDIVTVRFTSRPSPALQPYRIIKRKEEKLRLVSVRELTDEKPYEAYTSLRIVDTEGNPISADYPIDRELATYESMCFYVYEPTSMKCTFADLINNELLDWDKANHSTAGMYYKSYLEGYPLSLQDINRKKTMPYLITHFKRTEKGETTDGERIYKSDAMASVKWSWCNSGDSGQWDMPQRVYRPDLRTYLDGDYVSTKTRVRGGGASYSIRIDSVDNSNFILDALSFDLYGDSRV